MSSNIFRFSGSAQCARLRGGLCVVLLATSLTGLTAGIFAAVPPQPPPPPSVVVTPGTADGGDLGSNPTVADSSQCSAVVNNAPVTNDEVNVDGPHWKWSGTGSFLDDGTQNPDPSASGNETVAMYPHSPDTDPTCDYTATFDSPGDYVTTLTATATYYETALQGPNKGTVTPVSFSGSGNPGFPDPDAPAQAATASFSTTSSAPQQNSAQKIASVTGPWEYDPDTKANPLNWSSEYPDPTQGALQSCPGEKLIFNLVAGNDLDRKRRKGSTGSWTSIYGEGPYYIVLATSAGAAFNTPSGGTKGTPDTNGNVLLYINSAWTGTPITVTATLQDLAPNPVSLPDIGTTKDPDVTVTWTIKQRGTPPKSIYQTDPPGPPYNVWYPASETYQYQAGPTPPSYGGQTVTENLGNSSAVFTMDDLTSAFKAAHPNLVTPNQVSAFLYNAGGNASCQLNADNEMSDTIDGFGDVSMFTPAAQKNGIGYTLPQTFTACGNVLGQYTIERQYKNGTISVRKSGP